VSARVDATVDQGQYSQFIRAINGLDDAGVEKVLVFARELPRPKTLPAAPPETSPLWEEK
jgi:hypothetical protein